MTPRNKKVISRIRTFNADVSHERGEETPATPKLKKEKKTAQARANAILQNPKSNTLPEKAIQMKRVKPKSSHEFLSANADIPAIEQTPKEEPLVEIENDVFAGMEEIEKPKPLPRQIQVASSVEQKVKVADEALSDEVHHIQSHYTTTTTLNDTPDQVSLHADDSEGVIIQNKKKKRFRLFPEVGKSMKGWATSKQETITKSKEPTHVVRKADTRLDTISQAARASYHAPQSDHGIVVKRLAKKKRGKKETALSIKKKEEIAAPSWSHHTNEEMITPVAPKIEKAAIETPIITEPETVTTPELSIEAEVEPQPIDTQLKKRVLESPHSATSFLEATEDSSFQMSQVRQPKAVQAIKAPTPTVTSSPEPAVESKSVPPPTQEETVKPVTKPETAAQLQEKIPTPTPEAVALEAKTVPIHTSIPVEQRAVETSTTEIASAVEAQSTPIPQPVPQQTRKYTTPPVENVSRVPIYIYMLVIVGASLLGIGTSIYWFMSSTPTQEAVVISIPSLAQTNSQIPVSLAATRSETYSNILDVSLQSRETIQIYPTIQNEDGSTAPADVATIMQYLALRAPGSFTRSISEMTFGSVGGTDPFILMRVGNFDTAFAGMLAWEQLMSTDLSPLFGSPVSQSYDPYARTDSQIRSAFFRDTIITNKSARILVDANNTERIIYSFVQPNLILITTNASTFNTALPLISQ